MATTQSHRQATTMHVGVGVYLYWPCTRRRTLGGRAAAACCRDDRRLLLLLLLLLLMMMMRWRTVMLAVEAGSRDTWSQCRRTVSPQSRDRSCSSWSCTNTLTHCMRINTVNYRPTYTCFAYLAHPSCLPAGYMLYLCLKIFLVVETTRQLILKSTGPIFAKFSG